MALSANRVLTPRMGDEVLPDLLCLPVADNVHIYAGSLVGLDTSGRVRPMNVAAATTPYAVGRAEHEADNTIAGHSAGGINCTIRQGVFKWANDTNYAVAQAHVGTTCYAYDDFTVSSSSGSATRASAGTVVGIDADGGVWVSTHLEANANGAALAAVLVSTGSGSGADVVGVYDTNSRITGTTVRAALQECLFLGDLGIITYTPGVATGGFCDVVCALTNALGAAIAEARQVWIEALSVTATTGKNTLAAATSAVGTVIKSYNPAAGGSVQLMTASSGGLFSFKVTDSSNEALFLKITADGCRPVVKTITISGNA